MKVVLDTNTVVSGFLWRNEPRSVIEAAIRGQITLFTCAALIGELAGVLPRQKFARQLAQKRISISALLDRYVALTRSVQPAILSGPVCHDPDDDLVLATALAASADLIVSGDKHLRNLKHFHRIPIVHATDAVAKIRLLTRG